METEIINRIAEMEFWSSPVEPKPLGGGITNTNFWVDDQGERYVVRIGDDIPVHGVMRFNELAASMAAHAAGVSPEVVYHEKSLLVIRYIDGRTFTEEDVRDDQNLMRIIPLVRACHCEIPKFFQGPALIFWPFHVCRNYIRTAEEGGSRMSKLLPRFLKINAELEQMVGPIDLVFGHNDLLAANFIDDGERIWLVDWDYAGYNTPLFDLANLASNNGFDADQEDRLLQAYYRKDVTDGQRRSLACMKCISLLRETLWSIVQEIHSSLDFDFEEYTQKNLSRFEEAHAALE